MTARTALDIRYASHDRVRELKDIVRFCLEDISLSFDRWDEEHVSGPGIYFAIVSGHTVRDYADPMGNNKWPVNDCQDVLIDVDAFYEVVDTVARTRDGAAVISVDGVVQEQMVRFRGSSDPPSQPPEDQPARYADWMGARHMSAVDISLRPEVIGTMTLSAENGRVTQFEDGGYETTLREDIRSTWR